MARRPDLARGGLAASALVVAAAVALGDITTTLAAFASAADNPSNSITAAPDFRAPAVSTAAIGKTQGGSTGFLKQGGAYYVYANVAADTGNPASGLATIKANVANVTTGSTAVSLVAGSYTAGGASYGWRSAALTANATLTAGAKSFTVTATDNAANSGSLSGSVTVDNTAPAASDVQTTNAGTAGLAEQGDKLVLTTSEPIEPGTVLSGWSGTATSVVVRMTDGGVLGTGNDDLQVFSADNATLLPLGTVNLNRTDYVAGLAGGRIEFGATGTASTMTMSASTITITLGAYGTVGAGVTRTTAAAAGSATWTPVATPTDRASNVMSTATATESGTADKEF